MKVTLAPTNDWVTIDGVPHRMWDGQTGSGIPVQAAIARIAPLDATPAQMDAFRLEGHAAGMLPPSHPQNQRQVIKGA
jgi:hypothetical protein